MSGREGRGNNQNGSETKDFYTDPDELYESSRDPLREVTGHGRSKNLKIFLKVFRIKRG